MLVRCADSSADSRVCFFYEPKLMDLNAWFLLLCCASLMLIVVIACFALKFGSLAILCSCCSVINSLLGKKFLAEGILPTTNEICILK